MNRATAADPLLKIESLSLGALPAISFVLEEQSILGIKGASGVGKTRLLRAIADLDFHPAEMYLTNKTHLSFTAREWRKKVMYFPTESQWWEDQLENHFDHWNASYAEAIGFTKAQLDWSIDRLSSGEKQRFALLRGLNKQPSVLLLDEPTANLDEDNKQKVEALVRSYCIENNAVAIWVTHDIAQLKRVADRIGSLSTEGLTICMP